MNDLRLAVGEARPLDAIAEDKCPRLAKINAPA
jgi:hypothetical protein